MTITTAKFSLEDYHQMIEAEILAHRNVELIDGVIVEMSPEGTEHTYFGETLISLLRRLTEGQAWVREGRPITLSTSEPQPDIAVVRLPRSLYLTHHPYPEDIYLLIEISKSTFAFDTSEKKYIYATAGIIEYWVVDIQNKKVIVYRSPLLGDYQEMTTFKSGDVISPIAFPNLAISVDRIFAVES